jgi:hypothetical protein
MDTSSVISQVEASLAAQLQLGGGDPAVVAAGEAVLGALGPALRQAAMQLVEQAVAEVSPQVPEYDVQVVLADGEPSIVVRSDVSQASFSTEDLAARLTVRLPSDLKRQLEDAAGTAGDSVNTYIIKTLSSRAGRKAPRRRITGTFET